MDEVGVGEPQLRCLLTLLNKLRSGATTRAAMVPSTDPHVTWVDAVLRTCTRGRRGQMLPFLLAAPSLQLPAVDVLRSSVLRGLETSERGVYTAERQREELGRRLRDRLSGGDGLSRLAAADYAVRPGTSVAITGATEGIGREAARFLADANIGVIVCARDAAKAETAASYIREAGATAALAADS